MTAIRAEAKTARARPEHGAGGERADNHRAAAVADQVKAPQDSPKMAPESIRPSGTWRRETTSKMAGAANRAEGEQSANPDGNRQDCGEPEHKHSHHYN